MNLRTKITKSKFVDRENYTIFLIIYTLQIWSTIIKTNPHNYRPNTQYKKPINILFHSINRTWNLIHTAFALNVLFNTDHENSDKNQYIFSRE